MTASIELIGFGNMGRALAHGWVAKGREPASIAVVDPSEAARAAARADGFRIGPVQGAADVVVIAVKPAEIETALAGHAPGGAATVWLSIAAGRTIASIAAAVGSDAAIVRAMPNTPAAIGRGVTGLCASPRVTAEQRQTCAALMAAVGEVVWVDDEALMDAITAISGSGPAYVFLLIESLTAAGVSLGLNADVAATLATETVAGAGAYAAVAGVDAAELRRRVTSPKGTTQAALEILMADAGLASLLERAVQAAARRSRELAGGR